MNQGDIVLIKFPFSNLSDYKIRPAIVISNNEFNSRFDNWFCPITTKEQGHCIELNGSVAEGKLDNKSYARAGTIFTIEHQMILKRIGSLSKEKTKQIVEAIKKNF